MDALKGGRQREDIRRKGAGFGESRKESDETENVHLVLSSRANKKRVAGLGEKVCRRRVG